jgi:hypothetical protein
MAPPTHATRRGLPSIAKPVPVVECRSCGGGSASGPATRDRPPGDPLEGEPVILCRCGRWQVRTKRARVGRNPKTGTAAAIPARRVVRFVVSRTLKQAVAEVGSPAD